MLRGEIRIVDLDPARNGEADKRCPAVIVWMTASTPTPLTLAAGF